MRIVVTTSQKSDPELHNKAYIVANYLRTDFIPRNKIINLKDKQCVYMVVTKEGLVCHYQNQKLFFHPSMAMLRIKRIAKGETDIFTDLCGDLTGLTILDCTLGFGSDSLVFSYLTGNTGLVTSLEKSKVIYTIVSDGLNGNYHKWSDINSYANKIYTLNEDYRNYLKVCADNFFDIVYFDPMFEKPLEKSIHLNPLRSFADESPLSIDDIKQAKRIAKKMVIIKNNLNFPFSDIGITKVFSKNASKVKYGIIELGG